MKEPLCMKKVHSNFNRKIYMQVDGISMGSPLGPVLTDVFIIELEKAVSPELTECNKYWNRYVDDTISFVKIETINCIIEKLNSFENMQFTFEDEDKGALLFLDVLICRTCNLIVKNVLRKPTNNNIYLNSNTIAPDSWQRGTLKTIMECAWKKFSTRLTIILSALTNKSENKYSMNKTSKA